MTFPFSGAFASWNGFVSFVTLSYRPGKTSALYRSGIRHPQSYLCRAIDGLDDFGD